MCRVLAVSRSGYYSYRRRGQSAHDKDDTTLAVAITEISEEHRGVYGAPRIYQALRQRGVNVSERRVARLMREMGLSGLRRKRRSITTTNSNHGGPIAPNLLQRDFTAIAPNQVWVGDVTAVWTDEGWLFLAVFLDLFSRVVVGWATQARNDAQPTCAALRMAIQRRGIQGAVVVHTDRGVQYAAEEFRLVLQQFSMTPSMSRKGDCLDNAVSESVFASTKKELVYREEFSTRALGSEALFDYIEISYNRKRLHSTNGYFSPVDYEQMFASDARQCLSMNGTDRSNFAESQV